MGRIFQATGKSPIVNADLFFMANSDDNILACLSRRDIFIIRSYLWPFVEWRTRFARPVSGNVWEESTDDEFNAFMGAIQSLEEKLGDSMGNCFDGMVEIANAIRAIADKPCCNGGVGGDGGLVSSWVDEEGVSHPIYGTQPPYINDGETPPPGFDTFEDYLTNKCQVANLVFDGWLQTMRNLSLITVFNATGLATLLGLSFAGIIAFPPAAIPIAVGLLLTLGSFVVMFDELADNLQENKESIVCDLYNSSTVETMTAVLADALDVAIALISTTGPIGELLKGVALLLVNSDTLGQLLSGVAGLSYPGADCSACGGCELSFLVVDGITCGVGDLSANGEVRTLTSVSTSYGYIIGFSVDCECSPGGFTLDIDSMTGYVPYSGGGVSDPGDKGGGMVRCDTTSVWSYADETQPSGIYGVATCQFGPQATPFTMDVSISF